MINKFYKDVHFITEKCVQNENKKENALIITANYYIRIVINGENMIFVQEVNNALSIIE